MKNLHMFEKLCGKDSFKNIVLVTTMWDVLRQQDPTLQKGVERENQLLADEKFWGFMAKRGSRVLRHDGSKDSAWKLLTHVLEKQSSVVLDIQREMVDEHQTLDNTAAGQAVQIELQQVREKHQRDLQDLQESLQFALDEKDEEMANQIYQQQQEHRQMMDDAMLKQTELEIGLEALIDEHKRESDRRIRDIEQDRKRLEDELQTKHSEMLRINSRIGSMERTIHRKDSEYQSRIEEMIRSQQRQSEEDRRHFDRMMAEREASMQNDQDYANMVKQREVEMKVALEREIMDAEALNRRRGMSMSIIQMLTGTAVTGLGLYFGNPVAATAGLGLARRAVRGS